MNIQHLPDPSRSLAGALISAYPDYVRGQVGRFGEIEGMDEAIAAGRDWLEQQLFSVLSEPFQDQRRAPLELFQEALKFPTEKLDEAGFEPTRRDAVTTAALPGDLFDLAPASTRDLGEELWETHLRWGAAKAAAIKSLL